MLQSKYISDLLVKFNIVDKKPIYLPTVQDIRLEKNTKQVSANNIKLYQQQIDLLIYLITITKLDLIFSINNCARFINNFNLNYFKTIERI